MTHIERINLRRRSFIVGASATGLAFGYVASQGLAPDALAANAFGPTSWYSIGPDGVVTVMVGKAEMGQHVSSAMCQIVAEELEADWSKMKIALPQNDPKYNDPVLGALITGGSWSVRMNFDAMSRAGAAGRVTLIEAGAGMLGVKPEECRASNSQVIHSKTGKKVSYAKIVADGKASKVWTADELKALKLKTPDQYKLVGVAVPQLDIPSKINGTAKFGIDAMVPGMLYGKPVTPPVRYGAKVTAVDDADAKKVKGFVKAVTLDDKTGTTSGWVVAVATSYEGAKKAADALKVTYDKGPYAGVSDQTLIDEAKKLQADESSGQLFVSAGDPAAAIASAAKTFEAEYTTSINIHAPLEPMNALAYEQGGVWHIHTGNQFATRSGGVTAAALGVDPKNVVLHQYFMGGGFGRRLDADMAITAALAAKGVGKPVKLIYGREDDMAMDFTRPLTYQKVKAGTDADGKLVGLQHDVVCAWPTRAGASRRSWRRRSTRRVRSTPSPSTAPTSGTTVPNHKVRAILNELAQNATAFGPAAFGGARLDLLGGRKHARRAGARRRQGPGRLSPGHARRRGAPTRAGQEACQCAAHRGRPRRLGLGEPAQEQRTRHRLRLQPGARDRDLDGLRRPGRGQPDERQLRGRSGSPSRWTSARWSTPTASRRRSRARRCGACRWRCSSRRR
jgi:isoquinoline 1-oxidoreductase